MLQNLRTERRRTTRLRRRFLVHDRTGSARVARTSIDLCQDGLRLAIEREHVMGTVVELDLYLGDGHAPLRVQGEVMSADGGEAGIRFVDLAIKDRVRLVEALFGE
jgi:hypothetical protein